YGADQLPAGLKRCLLSGNDNPSDTISAGNGCIIGLSIDLKESRMQFIIALLKNLPKATIIAALVGVLVGLLIGWQTKEFKDAAPAYLRPDLQEDYLRMTLDSFRLNSDPNLAVQRWVNLGAGAQD